MLSSCPAPGWDRMGVDWRYICTSITRLNSSVSMLQLTRRGELCMLLIVKRNFGTINYNNTLWTIVRREGKRLSKKNSVFK